MKPSFSGAKAIIRGPDGSLVSISKKMAIASILSGRVEKVTMRDGSVAFLVDGGGLADDALVIWRGGRPMCSCGRTDDACEHILATVLDQDVLKALGAKSEEAALAATAKLSGRSSPLVDVSFGDESVAVPVAAAAAIARLAILVPRPEAMDEALQDEALELFRVAKRRGLGIEAGRVYSEDVVDWKEVDAVLSRLLSAVAAVMPVADDAPELEDYALGLVYALVAGASVAAVGPHATFKTSAARALANAIEKRVIRLRHSGDDFDADVSALARSLGLDPLAAVENTLPELRIYRTSGIVEIDCDWLHSDPDVEEIIALGFEVIEDEIVPISVEVVDLSGIDDPQTIFGVLDFSRESGGRAAIRSAAAAADVVVYDEAMRNPTALRVLGPALDRVGRRVHVYSRALDLKTGAAVVAFNPPDAKMAGRRVYSLVRDALDMAILSRIDAAFTVTRPVVPIRSYREWKGGGHLDDVGRVRLRDVLSLRRAIAAVGVPLGVYMYAIAAVASAAGCARAGEPVSKFSAQVSCESCPFRAESCSIMASDGPRALQALLDLARFFAMIDGRAVVTFEDLAAAYPKVMALRSVDPTGRVSVWNLAEKAELASRHLDVVRREVDEYARLIPELLTMLDLRLRGLTPPQSLVDAAASKIAEMNRAVPRILLHVLAGPASPAGGASTLLSVPSAAVVVNA